MSLVNEMLRDLEDRQDHISNQGAGVSPIMAHQHNTMPTGGKWALAIGLLLLIVAAVLWSWHSQWWQPVTEQITVASIDIGNVKTESTQDIALLEPNEENITEAKSTETTNVVDLIPMVTTTEKPNTEPTVSSLPQTIVAKKTESVTTANPLPKQPVTQPTIKPTIQPTVAIEESPPLSQQPLIEVTQAVQSITPSATTLDQQAVKTARALVAQGEPNRARSLLETHLQQNPDAHQSELELVLLDARALLAQQQLDKAKILLEQAPPAIDLYPDYHALLAGIYHKSGQHRAAAERYSQLVQINKDSPLYWLGFAVALDALRDNNALAAFRTSQSLNRNPAVQNYIEQRIAALSSKKENRQ